MKVFVYRVQENMKVGDEMFVIAHGVTSSGRMFPLPAVKQPATDDDLIQAAFFSPSARLTDQDEIVVVSDMATNTEARQALVKATATLGEVHGVRVD